MARHSDLPKTYCGPFGLAATWSIRIGSDITRCRSTGRAEMTGGLPLEQRAPRPDNDPAPG